MVTQEVSYQLEQSNIVINKNLEYALAYGRLGLPVLILHSVKDGKCTCGNDRCVSPAKHPYGALMPHGVKDATTDSRTIMAWWSSFPIGNIGIATGAKHGLWVIDVDIKPNEGKNGEFSLDAYEAKYGELPDTVMAKTGGGGKHYFFRYPVGKVIQNSTSKLGLCLDVRGENGYVAVEPSVHISGKCYEWISEQSPSEIPFAEYCLPDVFLESSPKKNITIPTQSLGGTEWDSMSAEQQQEFVYALYHCSNISRDDWLHHGFDIHSVDPTNRGYQLWCEWSKSRHDEDHNLFNEEDQARVWFSFKSDKSIKRNKESLFFDARKRGYKSALERSNLEQSHSIGSAVIDAINAESDVYSVFDTQETERHAPNFFPVLLLNQLADFINHTSSCYSSAATMQAVLALAATLVSRRYCTPQGDSLHCYFGISSSHDGTVGELRYATRGAREILRQCGLRRMVKESRISSSQALFKALALSPASLYLCDDYAAKIKLCTRQTTGGMEIVMNNLARLWGETFIQLDSPEEAGLKPSDFGLDKQPVIQRPSLSMLALIAYSNLPLLTKSSEQGRGSLDQFIFAICKDDDIFYKEENQAYLSQSLIDTLLKIRGIGLPYNGDFDLAEISGDLCGIEPDLIPVRYADGTEHYYKRIDEMTNDRRYRFFRASARKNFNRIVSILAVFLNYEYPIATTEIMQWALDYVCFNVQGLLDIMEVKSSDDGKNDIGQLVLEVIMRHGAQGIAPGQIYKYCRPFKALSKERREEILNQLVDDDDIKIMRVESISGNAAKKAIYSKYTNNLVKKQ